MDATEVFKREVLKPFLTLAVPGSVATAPYLLVAFHHYPELFDFWKQNSGSGLVLFLLFATPVGVILDNLGARLESNVWDKRLEKTRTDRRHNSEWAAYLKLNHDPNSIAEDYLQTVLLKLKFELGVGFALSAALPGLLWYRSVASVWAGCEFWTATALLIVLIGYLFWESYSSADLLGKTRHGILESRGKLPPKSPPTRE